MKKGTKHSKEGVNNIKTGMKKYWAERKAQDSSSSSSDKNSKLTVLSALLSRAAMAGRLGKQFDGHRDTYNVLGYKLNPDFNDFYAKYRRQDIAARVVDAAPQATWRRQPIIYEDNSKKPTTEFEIKWAKLAKRLKIYHYLERADRLSGIGRYGIILLGVRGSKGVDLSSPLKTGLQDESDISFVSVYTEGSAQIESYVNDPSDPQFGKPEYYKIDLTGNQIQDIGEVNKEILVHYTRVIHIAEGLEEDDVFGRPRMEIVYNRLDDLEKVAGGAPEMFWQGAYRGLHIDVNPEFQQGDLDVTELSNLNDEIDEYINGLRRFIRTQGVTVNTLKAQIEDPSSTYNMIMELICGASKIPKRIMLGSERGELASSQDEINWNSRVRERQEQFSEPVILRPFIDKLISLGALPQPKAEDYKIIWPSLFELNDLNKAQAVWTWARAAEKLASSVAVGILTKEQAFEVLNIPGLIGFSQLDPESTSQTGGGLESIGPKPNPPSVGNSPASEDTGQDPNF